MQKPFTCNYKTSRPTEHLRNIMTELITHDEVSPILRRWIDLYRYFPYRISRRRGIRWGTGWCPCSPTRTRMWPPWPPSFSSSSASITSAVLLNIQVKEKKVPTVKARRYRYRTGTYLERTFLPAFLSTVMVSRYRYIDNFFPGFG